VFIARNDRSTIDVSRQDALERRTGCTDWVGACVCVGTGTSSVAVAVGVAVDVAVTALAAAVGVAAVEVAPLDACAWAAGAPVEAATLVVGALATVVSTATSD